MNIFLSNDRPKLKWMIHVLLFKFIINLLWIIIKFINMYRSLFKIHLLVGRERSRTYLKKMPSPCFAGDEPIPSYLVASPLFPSCISSPSKTVLELPYPSRPSPSRPFLFLTTTHPLRKKMRFISDLIPVVLSESVPGEKGVSRPFF